MHLIMMPYVASKQTQSKKRVIIGSTVSLLQHLNNGKAGNNGKMLQMCSTNNQSKYGQ